MKLHRPRKSSVGKGLRLTRYWYKENGTLYIILIMKNTYFTENPDRRSVIRTRQFIETASLFQNHRVARKSKQIVTIHYVETMVLFATWFLIKGCAPIKCIPHFLLFYCDLDRFVAFSQSNVMSCTNILFLLLLTCVKKTMVKLL